MRKSNAMYETDSATSRRMASVRSLDTSPEKIVRRVLSELGFRYWLNCYDLPGRPDIVFYSLKKVIFVHGCFWHRHPGCHRATMPKRNELLWREKFKRTILRDQSNRQSLQNMGWKVLVVWECEIKDEKKLASILQLFIDME